MPASLAILDCTLRDGSYVIDFQFTAEDTALLCSALESAGIGRIEVGHGIGLGAWRQGGDQGSTDEDYLKAAVGAVRSSMVGAFFIPGIGTDDDLRLAADCGIHFVRIGSNITEFNDQIPSITLAKELGLEVSCNLMKSYAVPPAEFAERARNTEDAGGDVVCLVDSAGGMLPEDVRAYVEAARSAADVTVGFHGHDNLSMAVANTLEAFDAGATILDTSLKGLGRSEGNAVTEVVVAILQQRGLVPELHVNGLLDISEAFIAPLLHEPRRSSIGITSGRAKFHSSFLGRVTRAATRHGIDTRDLIMRLCERDTIEAPEDLIEELAQDLAASGPPKSVRVDIASTTAEAPKGFDEQVGERARELREKARKLGLESVLNIVVTPYEMTTVSPYVETRYGCAMSNIMIAEADQLEDVLAQVDGLVDYVLLDGGGSSLAKEPLKKSVLLTYLDHEMWARATVSHVTLLMGGRVHGKKLAITGIPPLALRAAQALAEAGAEVTLDSENLGTDYGFSLSTQTEQQQAAEKTRSPSPGFLLEAAETADAIISLSPRNPAVSADVVKAMRPGALLYDGGIGSIEGDAMPAAEARGVRVVRVDMRPSLAATALEAIGTRRIVEDHMGRDTWQGVSVVAGGLIGAKGDIIVDSIAQPTRVIGVADGQGGVLRPDPKDPEVLAVRQAIAGKQLAGD
jgi:4-hydroxy-2-oxovalerate aldolase